MGVNLDRLDILVKSGVIVDGSGNPWFYGDLGILDGRIIFIGKNCPYKAEETIDGRGLIVAPGFIDIHNHSDITIFSFPEAENLIFQGITTVVCGNCGYSLAPLISNVNEIKRYIEPFLPEDARIPWNWTTMEQFYDAIDSIKPSVNFLELCGHGTLRINIMGYVSDKASKEDIDNMCELLRKSLYEGAWGLSYGLLYTPGSYADFNELVSLAKVVGLAGGFCSIHLRNESYRLVEAVLEAIKICVEANVPLEISHHKASGRDNWGLVKTTLSIIRHYRKLGYDITVDVYPYTAGCTSLSALLPPWVHEGGLNEMLNRIRKKEVRERVSKELSKGNSWESLSKVAGWENIILTNLKVNAEFNGKSILEVSKIRGSDPVNTILDILLEENGGGEIILHTMNMDDVYTVMKSNVSMIGSDSWAWSYEVGGGHPRGYATYPRFIRLVRETGILSIEEAIRKTSSMPAWRVGLYNRGLLRPGFIADMVVFDYNEIGDVNSYENPAVKPKGIKYVIVNGKLAVEDGKLIGRYGRSIRRRI